MRKNQFLQRLRIAFNFIRTGKGNVRIMTCGKCGSMLIRSILEKPQEAQIIDEEHQIDLYWSDLNKCRKCGAVCQEVQMWNFEGDPCKINSGYEKVEEGEDDKRKS